MMKKSKLHAVLVLLLLSCSPIQAERKEGAGTNYPPVIQTLENSSPTEIILLFDKEVNAEKENFSIIPETGISTLVTEGKSLTIIPSENLKPGKEYFLRGTVSDSTDNSISLGASFYGYNPYLPEAVINEFTSNGSGNHPDMAEIFVKKGGSMAGITLYGGTKSSFADKLVFPDLEVQAGDYIIVHFKPEGLDTEINETTAMDAASGRDSSDTAWDFWITNGSGLSGNNGIISLYTNPYGKMMDCVIYTNRSSDSDTSYRGFGSTKFMLQADEAVSEGGWKKQGEAIAPEDCVSSDLSTATRSVCRNSLSEDTDSASDWHTVPTSKFSFGEKNNDDVYVK